MNIGANTSLLAIESVLLIGCQCLPKTIKY